ncbi:acetylxylan esterase [Streptomyces sp. NPDC048172]|uniref:acetylxylan esterase n=1 Tax=Streptomyces sp. NPDC048172 TaxID=3365505 RepID=UPI0037143A91
MPLADLPLAECRDFRPELPEPDGFDDFWSQTCREAEKHAGDPKFEPVENGLALVDTYDVTFTGFDGDPVRGWLHLPRTARDEPLGCVVEFLGYGRGRGLPHENTLWALAGHAHLVMDTRGQGWSASPGVTPDPGSAPHGTVPGFLTSGIHNPYTHYYRRLFTDAVRCVATARAHPAVAADRVVVAGVSQGGGMALAAAGLAPGLAGVMADVPFLCHIRRGVELALQPPYAGVAEYLRLHRDRDRTEAVFRTLSYFDAALLGARASAPALFSVAMRDEICPPSTCFTALNHYGGPKEARIYEFNGHEGGGQYQQREQLAWLRALLG